MIICYLALGSNLKTPERQIRLAIQVLRKLPRTHLVAVAPFYFNPAFGRKAQPAYCNTVVKIGTHLSPADLHQQCIAIEKSHLRVRKMRWSARTLDIDILYYGNRSLQTNLLTIPHPRIFERPFVLEPLKYLQQDSASEQDQALLMPRIAFR